MPYTVVYTEKGREWQIPCRSLPYALKVLDERIAFYGGTAVVIDTLTGKPV